MPIPTTARGRALLHLRTLAADTRFAFRYFARHKATTAIIVAVIALGTGANSVIFSIFQAQFLRPAPAVPENTAHARIVVQERPTRTARWQPRRFSQPELVALVAHREIFQDVAAWTEDDVVLRADSTAARGVGAQFVTSNYFGTLGVALSAGRGLRQTPDDTPDMTAVMSYAIAEQLFGGASAAVGRQVLVNEVPVHIVGVAPERFQGALRGMDEPALWMPLSARADIARVSRRWLTDEAAMSLLARLAAGARREQATALARQVVASTLPDSAARVGMARTAYVLGMNEPSPGNESTELVIVIAPVPLAVASAATWVPACRAALVDPARTLRVE